MRLLGLMSTASATLHCADGGGRVIGLAADGHYTIRSAQNGRPPTWTPNSGGPCANSFSGTYMQVLPDSHQTLYPQSGPAFTMTGLAFDLRVATAGLHTLFLRWTGGDTVGGGDSLYVVLYDAQNRLVSGVPTFKPRMESIAATPGRYVSQTMIERHDSSAALLLRLSSHAGARLLMVCVCCRSLYGRPAAATTL